MSLVLECDGFGGGCEDDLVFTDHAAHAERVNTDLFFRSFLMTVSAANENGVGLGFFDLICEHESRSAGSVELLIVVLFDDLNIRFGHESRRALCEIREHGNADGHIGTAEDRNRFCRFVDHFKLLYGVTGRCNDAGGIRSDGVIHQILGAGVVGKVNDHVCLSVKVGKIFEHAGVGAVCADVYAARDLRAVFTAFEKRPYLCAHFAESAVHKYFHGNPFLS